METIVERCKYCKTVLEIDWEEGETASVKCPECDCLMFIDRKGEIHYLDLNGGEDKKGK